MRYNFWVKDLLFIFKRSVILPTMTFGGAHTSIISVFHSFITQWYSNDPQFCSKSEQRFSIVLFRNSSVVPGQESTTVTVGADSMHLCRIFAFYRIEKHFTVLQKNIQKNLSLFVRNGSKSLLSWCPKRLFCHLYVITSITLLWGSFSFGYLFFPLCISRRWFTNIFCWPDYLYCT